jgi:2-oxoglutarate ferredoxin oxidoreductase subunit alpha
MTATMEPNTPLNHATEVDSVVIRFAGDSGDGMQTVGDQFTDASALLGNDISTFPDFPAEIRAPQGTLPGVSGFQIQLGSKEILTPGDAPDALVAMNPAALKVNLSALVPKGLLVVNTGAFTDANLKKAGYAENPLESGELSEYKVIEIDMTGLCKEALKESPLKNPQKVQCKNFFALGFMYWVYNRELDYSLRWIANKWPKKPEVVDANTKVLKAGFYYGETTESIVSNYKISKANVPPGTYRKISGNDALVMGLIAGGSLAQRGLVLGSYPITPASSILEGLAKHKNFNVKTVQAEDEISAIGVALGASFAGSIGLTSTSGPGLALKGEFLGLAVMTELPLVVINVQRGGPSTGLPTKTEQSDLLQAMYGRNGECPAPVLAASSPGDCFEVAIEAIRIALKYKTPVLLLSDGYIANGAEPWKIPSMSDYSSIAEENAKTGDDYVIYKRDPETLARQLAIPGTKGLEHRLGGLEKNEEGAVSYDAENHEKMVRLRDAKVKGIAKTYPKTQVNGNDQGDLLILGWGGTWGAITSATKELQAEGVSVSSVHLRYIHPLPNDLESLLKNFKKVLIPELNLGQLNSVIRAEYLIDTEVFHKVKGLPFTIQEIKDRVHELLAKESV